MFNSSKVQEFLGSTRPVDNWPCGLFPDEEIMNSVPKEGL